MARLGTDVADVPFPGINAVCDGNSLVFGVGATVPMPAQLLTKLATVSGITPTAPNVGVSGQSTRQMNGLDGGSSADVDAAWVAGKNNILVAWEGTNSVAFYGRTPAQGATDMTDYIAARRAVHPWWVVLLTTLPRFETGNDALLRDYNTLAKANYLAWGADVLVDVRSAGSPFNFDGETSTGFVATQSLWFETSNWVHLNDAGYAIIADRVASAIGTLSKRAHP